MANTIDRVSEHRQRMHENGYRQINLLLHQRIISEIDKRAKLEKATRAELISRLMESERK